MKKIFVIFLSLFLIHAATADDVFNTSVTNGCATDILGITENVSIEPVFEPKSIQCSTGQYLPVNTANCETCPAESTCTAGTYTFNETKSQGIVYNDPFTQNKPKGCAENILGIAAAVSFEPVFELKNIQCASGYYLAANNATCSQCTSGSYCPGGTYTFSETDDQGAIACPTGYDYNTALGKTSVTQCQIHCDAGTYVSAYTQVEYLESSGTQYIDTGVVATLQTGVWLRAAIMSRRNNADNIIFGATDATAFANGNPFAIDVFTTSKIYLPHGGSGSSYSLNSMNFSNANNTVYDFKVNYMNDGKGYANTSQMNLGASTAMTTRSLRVFDLNTSTGGLSPYSPLGARVYDLILTEGSTISHHFVPVRRDSDGVLGMYDTVSNTFFINSGTGEFIAGPDVGVLGGACVNVGVGYWAAASMVNFGSLGVRNACPVGTTTVGYGHGADSANDCGRVLHIGDYVLYARRDRVTSPSLNIRIPEEGIIYYINLGSENHDLSRLHLMLDGVQYTAYDDSLYYGERNFDTGEQITQ